MKYFSINMYLQNVVPVFFWKYDTKTTP